jgi:hypothetical protein
MRISLSERCITPLESIPKAVTFLGIVFSGTWVIATDSSAAIRDDEGTIAG